MNILMNPTIWNNILDQHMQLNLNYKQQHGSNKQSQDITISMKSSFKMSHIFHIYFIWFINH